MNESIKALVELDYGKEEVIKIAKTFTCFV